MLHCALSRYTAVAFLWTFPLVIAFVVVDGSTWHFVEFEVDWLFPSSGMMDIGHMHLACRPSATLCDVNKHSRW